MLPLLSFNNINDNKNIINNKTVLKQNDTNYSQVDDYIEQDINYINPNDIPEEYRENNNADIDYSQVPSNWFYDNGHYDDSKSGAIKISPYSGKIIGKLGLNDNWTKFLYCAGERDEDYFRFSTREKLQYTFLFDNPSDYRIRLIKYVGNKLYANCQNVMNK